MATVIITLQGGLGNQMFQYATARGIAMSEPILDLYLLKKYSVSTDRFTAKRLELSLFPGIKYKVASRFIEALMYNRGLLYRIGRRLVKARFGYLIQNEHKFYPGLLKNKRPIVLEGYFQSEKYFRHIRPQLLQEFNFPSIHHRNDQVLERIQSCRNAVSIHVRRGDYLMPDNQSYLGVLPFSYYQAAVTMLENKLEKPLYFIFSDDTDWCERHFNFLGNRYMVVRGNEGSEAWMDMYLMTRCKHHVIANSSFSWWGAWLSEFENSIQIAPRRWFKSAPYRIEDFVPESWTILNFKDEGDIATPTAPAPLQLN